MGMVQQMQHKMEQARKGLDDLQVTGEAGNGAVRVTATASKRIININISPNLLSDGDTEALEDLLLTAINRALDNATHLHDQEMAKVGDGILPPGFNLPDFM